MHQTTKSGGISRINFAHSPAAQRNLMSSLRSDFKWSLWSAWGLPQMNQSKLNHVLWFHEVEFHACDNTTHRLWFPPTAHIQGNELGVLGFSLLYHESGVSGSKFRQLHLHMRFWRRWYAWALELLPVTPTEHSNPWGKSSIRRLSMKFTPAWITQHLRGILCSAGLHQFVVPLNNRTWDALLFDMFIGRFPATNMCDHCKGSSKQSPQPKLQGRRL